MFFLFHFDESTKSQKSRIFWGVFFFVFRGHIYYIYLQKFFSSSRCLVVKGKVLQPLALTLYAITLAAASWFTQGSPIYVLSIVLLKAYNKSFVISWYIIVTRKYGWLRLPIFLPFGNKARPFTFSEFSFDIEMSQIHDFVNRGCQKVKGCRRWGHGSPSFWQIS